MLTKLDLSGFAMKGFNRSLLREVLQTLPQLPCLRAVSLRNNNIDEEYEREVLSIFEHKQIQSIDLSRNMIGKKLAADIGKTLRDQC
jgi:hypothetical protein